MDGLSALASGLQVASQCTQCIVAIMKWWREVQTVDERVSSFHSDLFTLRANYTTLHDALKAATKKRGVRSTEAGADDRIWKQIEANLKECQQTVTAISKILDEIEVEYKVARRILKQLNEYLSSGDLARLRDRVPVINGSLTLSLQMFTVIAQIEQQDQNEQHYHKLLERTKTLETMIESMQEKLQLFVSQPTLQRTFTFGGSTVVDEAVVERKFADNMTACVETARKVVLEASERATSHHGTSVASPEDLALRKSTNFGVFSTPAELDRIDQYLNDIPGTIRKLSHPEIEGLGVHTEEAHKNPRQDKHQGSRFHREKTGEHVDDDDSDEDDVHDDSDDTESDDDDDGGGGGVELQLTKRFLSNGQRSEECGDFGKAEANFRQALQRLQRRDFGPAIACEASDVIIMLSRCCLKQKKYAEAISLLKPLADTKKTGRPEPSADLGPLSSSKSRQKSAVMQSLAACHLLGEVYLRKQDFADAEKYCTKAFKRRHKLLGPEKPETIESVKLVVEMYETQGHDVQAEAYSEFLKPQESRSETTNLTRTLTPAETPPMPTVDPVESKKSRKLSFPWRTPKSEQEERPVPRKLGRVSFVGSPAQDEHMPMPTSPDNLSTVSLEEPRRSFQNRAMSQTSSIFADGFEDEFVLFQSYHSHNQPKRAMSHAIELLKRYDGGERSILLPRRPELEKNIKKAGEKGLSGTGHGYAPIHFFCELDRETTAEVSVLLKYGADPNATASRIGCTDGNTITPLDLAVARGHEATVRALLKAGAKVQAAPLISVMGNVSDREGLHPLLVACQAGHVEVVRTLLESHFEMGEQHFVKTRVWHGNSLLHQACWLCDLDMIRYLMTCPPALRRETGQYSIVGRVDQQDQFGITPLMYAVDMRDVTEPRKRTYKLQIRTRCVQLILDAATSPTTPSRGTSVPDPTRSGALANALQVKDKWGNTVYSYADREPDTHLTKLLHDYGAKSMLIDLGEASIGNDAMGGHAPVELAAPLIPVRQRQFSAASNVSKVTGKASVRVEAIPTFSKKSSTAGELI